MAHSQHQLEAPGSSSYILGVNTAQTPINSGYGFTSTAEEIARGHDLKGKTIAITGGHSGIGLETSRVLSNAGARVIVGARDFQKAQTALRQLANVEAIPLDLSDPGSIDRFAAQLPKLDVLINNAGIMAAPLTRDGRGYELQFATNHLGHFQLTLRLADRLQNARVVTLTSAGHRFAPVDLQDPNFERRAYDKWAAYGQSKTANSLFSLELDRRGQKRGLRAFAVHPGRILATDLLRHMSADEVAAARNSTGIKTIEQGAATTIWCALSPQLEGRGGVYCADCDIAPVVEDVERNLAGVLPWAIDESAARALWTLSEQLTQLEWAS